MNASTKSPIYDRWSLQWQKSRDVLMGQKSVHDRGEVYLPRLEGQTDTEYKAYKCRTPFYGASRRTLNGLVGMVFRKPPQIVHPESMAGIVADMTLSVDNTESLTSICQRSLFEVAGVGRVAWLVEYPMTQGETLTRAEAAARNLRPYATMYATESIIDWRCDRINNSAQLVMVKLSEVVTEWSDNYARTDVNQERWLLLIDGMYVQRIYRNGSQVGDDIIPLMNGAPLPYIPFVGITPAGLGLDCPEPPLLDLYDLNLSHYRTTADLEHGAHFTGLPTPVVFGAQLPEGQNLSVGSTTAWVFPNSDGSAEFLEFSGQGLGALEKLLDRKEQQMAALGARMLAPEKTGVEAAATLAMRSNGESSVLAAMANRVSEGMTRVLTIMRDWTSTNGDVSVQLNTDYAPAGMTAQELLALVQTWQAGGISHETFYYNIQQGEMTQEGVTFEDEQARIQSQVPPGSQVE